MEEIKLLYSQLTKIIYIAKFSKKWAVLQKRPLTEAEVKLVLDVHLDKQSEKKHLEDSSDK